MASVMSGENRAVGLMSHSVLRKPSVTWDLALPPISLRPRLVLGAAAAENDGSVPGTLVNAWRKRPQRTQGLFGRRMCATRSRFP